METPIVKPRILDLGTVSPGRRGTTSCQLHAPSDTTVRAAIVDDASGAFRVRQVACFDLVAGIGPHPRSASDGESPLDVRRGQLVAIDVDVEPPDGTRGVLEGVLEIRGSGWEPIRRPLHAVVASR